MKLLKGIKEFFSALFSLMGFTILEGTKVKKDEKKK